MKLFICDKCGRIFYSTELSNNLDEDKMPDLCPKCKRKLVDFCLKFKDKEGDGFDYLDEFCNQLKRIKGTSPELRIGQVIYLINSKISDDWDSFYIEDKDYIKIAEDYANKLEREKEKGR